MSNQEISSRSLRHQYNQASNIFPVPLSYVPKIEAALCVSLTEAQIMKLRYPEYTLIGGTSSSKLLISCILLALSIGPPLELKAFDDVEVNKSPFIRLYKNVARDLELAGFSVREVNGYGGWKCDIWGDKYADFTTDVKGEKYTVTHIPAINREEGKYIKGKDMLNATRIVTMLEKKKQPSVRYVDGLKWLKEAE